MGRISVDIPDELEKMLRFKTVDKFGGKKGDLSRAVEEAVSTWVAKKRIGALILTLRLSWDALDSEFFQPLDFFKI